VRLLLLVLFLASGESLWSTQEPEHQTLDLPLASGGSERLSVEAFPPEGPVRGVVLFLHGYMASASEFPFTRDWFVNRGWVVTTLDLPGHGQSEGPRHDIEAFSTYGDAVTLWLEWVERQGWPGPRVLLAHSLGAAAALEALRRPGAPRPDRVVFCAPLLRTDWYQGLSLADHLVGGWLPALAFPDYRARAHWFFALEKWLGELKKLSSPLDLPLTVYSGDRDSVVDEGWNKKELKRLVPNLRWVTLPEKDHWFLTVEKDRQAVHERIEADLGF